MDTTSLLVALAFLSVVVGAVRFFIPGHDLSWPGTYEALAHIWVGVLSALALFPPGEAPDDRKRVRVVAVVSLVVTTAVEIGAFLTR